MLGGMDSLLVGLWTEPLRPLRGHLPFQGRLLGRHATFSAGNFLLHTLGLNSKAAPVVCHRECSLWLGFYKRFDTPTGEFIRLPPTRAAVLLLRKKARVRLDAMQGRMHLVSISPCLPNCFLPALLMPLAHYSPSSRAIKSCLFCCVVVVGRPKSSRAPMAHFTSINVSASACCAAASAASSASKVATETACA